MKTINIWKRLLMVCVVLSVTAVLSLQTTSFAIEINTSGGETIISPGEYPSLAGGDDTEDLINAALGGTKVIAMGITGGCALIAFIALIFAITKLTAAGDDPQRRKNAIVGILASGVGIALLGSSTAFIYFFWNLFASTSGP